MFIIIFLRYTIRFFWRNTCRCKTWLDRMWISRCQVLIWRLWGPCGLPLRLHRCHGYAAVLCCSSTRESLGAWLSHLSPRSASSVFGLPNCKAQVVQPPERMWQSQRFISNNLPRKWNHFLRHWVDLHTIKHPCKYEWLKIWYHMISLKLSGPLSGKPSDLPATRIS